MTVVEDRRWVRFALAGAFAAAGEAALWIGRGWALDYYPGLAFVLILPWAAAGFIVGIPMGIVMQRCRWTTLIKSISLFVLIGFLCAIGSRLIYVVEAMLGGSSDPTFGLFIGSQSTNSLVNIPEEALAFSLAGLIYWLVAFQSCSDESAEPSAGGWLRLLNTLFLLVPAIYVGFVVYLVIRRLIFFDV